MSYRTAALGTSLAWEFDWTAETPEATGIASSTWIVGPAGQGVSVKTPSRDGLLTQVTVEVAEDATVGVFLITNVVVFDDGSFDRKSFSLRTAHVAEVV